METPASRRPTLAQCWVIPLVIIWKLGLLAAGALPPPANDAFFFDGAAVNFLGGGTYVNPAIVRVFPTSGAEFFSAYPPLYQPVVLGWMSVFGPSAMSSLLLHGVLFAGFALLAFDFLRRLGVPCGAINGGGFFLFALTFHDRPDSVAHVLGLLALVARQRGGANRDTRARLEWLAAAAVVLAIATSLHLGAMYATMLWLHALLRRRIERLPVAPLATTIVAPLALAALAVGIFPVVGRGFVENLRVTPSLTGLHWPGVTDLLKVGRVTLALFVIAGAVGWLARRTGSDASTAPARDRDDWLLAIGAGALFAALAALFLVGPSYGQVAGYPQVIVVALFLWRVAPLATAWRAVVGACALLAAVRAIGLSTWGVACAFDVSRIEAESRARAAIAQLPERAEALVSSAYLYTLAGQGKVTCHHSDWPGPLAAGPKALRPVCLVLTAFDYHRRYQTEIAAQVAAGRVRVVSIEHAVRVPPPDAFPRWQRVLQHVSWAPVIVRLDWL